MPAGPCSCRALCLPGYRSEVGQRHPDLRRLAPVDGEHRAGDVGGVVGGEEGRRGGELRWLGQPADRHRLAKAPHLVLGHHAAEHRRAVGPGAIALTRTPCAAWSTAIALVSMATPPFDAT